MMAGGAAVVALLFWGVLWRPLAKDNARLEEQLPRLRAQAARLARAGDEITRLRAQAPAAPTDMQQSRSILERSASVHGLTGGIFGNSPDGAHQISAQFKAASFSAWVAWVDELHRRHRVWLVSCRVIALDAPGMVRIEAVFGAHAPQAR